jgi:hypothetical protein
MCGRHVPASPRVARGRATLRRERRVAGEVPVIWEMFDRLEARDDPRQLDGRWGAL